YQNEQEEDASSEDFEVIEVADGWSYIDNWLTPEGGSLLHLLRSNRVSNHHHRIRGPTRERCHRPGCGRAPLWTAYGRSTGVHSRGMGGWSPAKLTYLSRPYGGISIPPLATSRKQFNTLAQCRRPNRPPDNRIEFPWFVQVGR